MVVVVFIAIVTAIEVTALDLRLFQRAWCSNDAQNEHEKGHDKQDGLAHFARVVEGVRLLRCWGAKLPPEH